MKRLKSRVQAVVVLIFLLSNRATATADDDDDDSNLIISSNDNDDQQKSNKNVNSIDLEELNPKENNCRLEKSPITTTTVKCSRIPLFCRSVCEQTRRLSLDSSLKRISSFSFGAYKVTDTSLDISFTNDLTRIDTDAFNGMVVAEDATVTINIGEPTKSYDEQATVSNDSDENDADENSSSQIEYDMPTPSTKPDETVLAGGSARLPPSRMSLKTLYVAPNAFRGLLVKESARLVVNVNGYDKIEFGPQSLVNMKQMSASVFSFVVAQSGLVVFQSRCADAWRPYNNDYLDPSSNDYDASKSIDYSSDQTPIEDVMFKLSVKNVNKVLFERESFVNMRLFNSSTFQIQLADFDEAIVARASFSGLVQQRAANFELNLSNGKDIKLGSGLFSNLVQSEKSKLVVYFGLDSSARTTDICLSEETFGGLQQAANSTVRVTFLGTSGTSVSVGGRAFARVTQAAGSVVQVYVLRVRNVRVESEALSNVTQASDSSFEIWTSKLSGNFTVGARAFRALVQADRSLMRVGYTAAAATTATSTSTSSSSSSSMFIQSPMAFEKWNSTSTSMFIYDFTQDTNFKLGFPGRPMPRMLMSTGNETQEEASMRLFPNLGRSSRPDTISFNEYQLSERDFCRLVDIPFDVLVRVPATAAAHANQCSCSLFYLYRVVRRVRPDWLVTLPLPACYRDLLAEPRLIDEAERTCEFAEKVRKCREERAGVDWLSYSDSTAGQCRVEQFDYYRENTFVGAKKTSTTSANSVVDNDADDDDIDDDNDSGWNDVDDDDEAEILEDNSIAKQPVSASIEYDEDNDDQSGAVSNNNNNNNNNIDQNKQNQIFIGSQNDDQLIDDDDDENDDDDEEDDDEDDEDDDDDDDPTLPRPDDSPTPRQSSSSFNNPIESLRRIVAASTLFELAVITVTSLVLVVILIAVLVIVVRRLTARGGSGATGRRAAARRPIFLCTCCRRSDNKNGFSAYYDESDDDDDDQDDDDDANVFDNEFIERKKKKYSSYETRAADDPAPDYAVVVKCEKSLSSTAVGLLPAQSAGLRDDVSHYGSTTGLINVKSNPLENV